MLAAMATPAPREQQLVDRARAGDTAAFEELYRAHADRVRALCTRMTADPGLGDDLCQRTFVRAWQQLHAFRGDSAWGTWLHRIAVTQVLMEQRSSGRRQGRVLALPRPERTTTDRAGMLLDLERALTRLPERARAVFVLHDVEGHRHAEVADLLGITVGTSKAQLHRARRLLRTELNR